MPPKTEPRSHTGPAPAGTNGQNPQPAPEREKALNDEAPKPHWPCSCRDERPKPTSRSRPGNASEDGAPKPHRPRSSVSFVLHPRRSQPDTRLPRPSAPIPPTACPGRRFPHPSSSLSAAPLPKRNGNPNRTQQIGLTRPRIRPFQTAEKPRPRPHSGDSPRCKELRTEFGIS